MRSSMLRRKMMMKSGPVFSRIARTISSGSLRNPSTNVPSQPRTQYKPPTRTLAQCCSSASQ
eukprot:1308599-Rhodomonas_salina.3